MPHAAPSPGPAVPAVTAVLTGLESLVDKSLLQREEAPGPVEQRERTVDEADVHRLVRRVGVARRESMTHARVGQVHASREAACFALQDVDLLAPGQKARVVFDRGHERVHLVRRVPQQDRLLDVLHTMKKL